MSKLLLGFLMSVCFTFSSFANDAFKAEMIENALNSKEKAIAALETSNMQDNQKLIAKIEKDVEEKVALMQELDPQTLKDMMIMDTQKVQSSNNLMFFAWRGFFLESDSIFAEGISNCKRRERGPSCFVLGLLILSAPVMATIATTIDLVTLPITFIASALTGF